MPNILPSFVETTDAAANVSTSYALAIGQTAQGNLSALGDHDWYKVSLAAGQTYSFAMVGTGTNNVHDSYLWVRDGAGNVLSSDDDSGPNGNSWITFTAPATGAYFLDTGAYNNSGTGQYGVSATLGARPSFDVAMGGGAIDSDLSWSSPGTGVTVTYGFRQSAATYTVSGSNIATFSQCSAAQMTAVQSILQLWSDVCNVTFQRANSNGYTNSATILIANYRDSSDGAGAFAFYPGSTLTSSSAGDLWLNLGGGMSASSVPLGSYSWFATMHELGHALGLSHPGDYNAGAGVTITYWNSAQFIQDTEQYSVMSYFGGSYTGQSPGNFATADTPMLFDVYELQRIYGANTTTRSGDTVYGFGSTAGSVYDFSYNVTPQVCIWDAGGLDTLDCSGYVQNQLIDLNAGEFSNVGGLTANISIALGAVIENATGGAGSDTIIGNAADNRLRGGGGNDSISGGAGADTAIFSGPFSEYQLISYNGSTTQVVISGPDGTDTLIGIEYLQFQDQTVFWQALATPIIVEAQGSTSLVRVGNNYSLAPVGSSSGPTLSYSGSPFSLGFFGSWTPFATETVSGGYQVAWRNGSADEYTVWTTDASGNYVSNINCVAGASITFESYEPVFQQDLNGDGLISPAASNSFEIAVNYVGDASYRNYFISAAQRWRQVITADLLDVSSGSLTNMAGTLGFDLTSPVVFEEPPATANGRSIELLNNFLVTLFVQSPGMTSPPATALTQAADTSLSQPLT